MIATKALTTRDLREERSGRNNLHRWFEPDVGRWLSDDPIGFTADDPNLYRYVRNFATGTTDPSGLEPPIETRRRFNQQTARRNAENSGGGGRQLVPPPPHGVPQNVTPAQIAGARGQLDYWARRYTGFSYNTLQQMDSEAVDLMRKLLGIGQAGNALCDVASIGRSINAARGMNIGRSINAARKTAPSEVVQGLSQTQLDELVSSVRSSAGHISDDIFVHGSRASGTARATSDIDIALRVDADKFDDLIRQRFGTPNPGSAKERTMLHAIETGKIHSGEAGLRGLRKQLEGQLEIDVDISVIRRGGPFDQGPRVPLGGG